MKFLILLAGFSVAVMGADLRPELEGVYDVQFDCSGCKAPHLSKHLDSQMGMVVTRNASKEVIVSFHEPKFGIPAFTLKLTRVGGQGEYIEGSSLGVDDEPLEMRILIDLVTGKVDGLLVTAANEVRITGQRKSALYGFYQTAPVKVLEEAEVEGKYVAANGTELYVRRMMLGDSPRFVATAWLGGVVATHFQHGSFDAQKGILNLEGADGHRWVLAYRLDSYSKPSWIGMTMGSQTSTSRELHFTKQ